MKTLKMEHVFYQTRNAFASLLGQKLCVDYVCRALTQSAELQIQHRAAVNAAAILSITQGTSAYRFVLNTFCNIFRLLVSKSVKYLIQPTPTQTKARKCPRHINIGTDGLFKNPLSNHGIFFMTGEPADSDRVLQPTRVTQPTDSPKQPQPYPILDTSTRFNPDNIPAGLKARKQWCVWGKRKLNGVDSLAKPDSNGIAKLDKRPFNPIAGKMASSNKTATWVNFDDAQRAYESGWYNGVGFFFDSETGIDLDHCLTDGQLTIEAQLIVDHFPGAFIEISPSGDGLHIICTGTPIASGKGQKSKWIEVYGCDVRGKKSNRYFTVTGNLFAGATLELINGQSGLAWLHDTYKAAKPTAPKPTAPKRHPPTQFVYDADRERELVDNALNFISPDVHYEDWIKIGTALKAGGYSIDVWEHWSCGGAKYKSGGCQKHWHSFDVNKVSLGSLFELAKQGGFEFPKYKVRKYTNTVTPQVTSKATPKTPKTQTKPELIINRTEFDEQIDFTINAMVKQHAENPQIFSYMGNLTRIDQRVNKDGTKQIELTKLNSSQVQVEAAKCVSCMQLNERKNTLRPCNPSRDLSSGLIGLSNYDQFNVLEQLITAPTVLKNGRVIKKPGYDQETGIYYHAPEKLNLGDTEPTASNVEKAKNLIFNDLLGDFPFKSNSDRANAAALFLLPFCQNIISANTPLHAITAPTQASGKTLLTELLCKVFNPLLSVSGAPKNIDAEPEWKKLITTKLMVGHSHIVFDNLEHKLESPTLAAILTSRVWSDRLLGGNKEVTVENNAVFVVTGNNMQFGDDMLRRVLEIRLEPTCESPEERTDIKKKNIREWARVNRERLVAAAIVLIRNWFEKPKSNVQYKQWGSFEKWAEVMSGILSAAGIEGLMENRQQTRARAAPGKIIWRNFYAAWWEKYQTTHVKASDLYSVAKGCGLFEDLISAKTERGEILQLSKKLKQFEDRIFGEWKARRITENRRITFCLEKITLTPKPPTDGGKKAELVEPKMTTAPTATKLETVSADVVDLSSQDSRGTEYTPNENNHGGSSKYVTPIGGNPAISAEDVEKRNESSAVSILYSGNSAISAEDVEKPPVVVSADINQIALSRSEKTEKWLNDLRNIWKNTEISDWEETLSALDKIGINDDDIWNDIFDFTSSEGEGCSKHKLLEYVTSLLRLTVNNCSSRWEHRGHHPGGIYRDQDDS